MTPRLYDAFGLSLSSTLALPELLPGEGVPQVRIREASVPPTLDAPRHEGVCYQATNAEVLLKVPGVARVLVSHGREILVQAEPGADAASLRCLVLWQALRIVMQQRGMLVLRGSAVALRGRALVLAGPPGSGTSTLAAALLRQGFAALCDDLCACVLPPEGSARASAGIQHLLLWPDSLKAVRPGAPTTTRLRPLAERRVLVPPRSSPERSVVITDICVVHRGTKAACACEALTGVEAFNAILPCGRRASYLDDARLDAAAFRDTAQLANRVRVYRLNRPTGLATLEHVVETLLDRIGT